MHMKIQRKYRMALCTPPQCGHLIPHTQETGTGTLCVDGDTAMFSRAYFRNQP